MRHDTFELQELCPARVGQNQQPAAALLCLVLLVVGVGKSALTTAENINAKSVNCAPHCVLQGHDRPAACYPVYMQQLAKEQLSSLDSVKSDQFQHPDKYCKTILCRSPLHAGDSRHLANKEPLPTRNIPVHPVEVSSHEDASSTFWRWAGLTQALNLAAVIHLENQ